MKIRYILLLVLVGTLAVVGIRQFRTSEPDYIERSMELMNTRSRVMIPPEDRHLLGSSASYVRTMAERVAPLVDINDRNSEIARINRVASRTRFPLSRDMYRILDIAQRMNEATNGAYDITTISLMPLWGLQKDPVPEHDLNAAMRGAARAGVGLDKISLSPDSIRFNSPHTRIDVGNLAEGYVVDMSIIQLRRQGVTNLLVQLGDNVRTLGRAGNRGPWRLDIAHPLEHGKRIGVLSIPNAYAASTVRSDVTASSELQYPVHRILDPRTGQPAAGMQTVTVIGPTATESYALAMGLHVAGIEEGMQILARHPRYHALFIPDREPLEILVTREFANHFMAEPEYANALRIFEHPTE